MRRNLLSHTLRRSLPLLLGLAAFAAVVTPEAPADAGEKRGMVIMMNKVEEYIKAGDYTMAGAGLGFIGRMAPRDKEFAGWKPIVDKAQRAAMARDPIGMRASCTDCHDKYRTLYKSKYGGKNPKPGDE